MKQSKRLAFAGTVVVAVLIVGAIIVGAMYMLMSWADSIWGMKGAFGMAIALVIAWIFGIAYVGADEFVEEDEKDETA